MNRKEIHVSDFEFVLTAYRHQITKQKCYEFFFVSCKGMKNGWTFMSQWKKSMTYNILYV